MSLTVCVDFDGTITDDQQLLPGVREALHAMKRVGNTLILHSCRCNLLDASPQMDEEVARFYATGEVPARALDRWRAFLQMRDFLRGQQLWDLFDTVWQSPGKPVADVYIDDRAQLPDWPNIMCTYGVPNE